MARRPPYSEEAFLKAIFHPNKSELPTGLRKVTLKASKGRRVSRVNAWNKFPAEKQRVISEAGMRERFLSGDVTYTDAKRALRRRAESLGITNPVQRSPKNRVVRHILSIIPSPRISLPHIETNVERMTPAQRRRVESFNDGDEYINDMDYEDEEGDPYWEYEEGGAEYNLLWYH
jgi:hypothetical protein